MVDAQTLGGRIALLIPSEVTEAQTDFFNAARRALEPRAETYGFEIGTADGRLIGPVNALAYSPETGEAFLQLQGQEETNTSLSARVRQVVILTVGGLMGADYITYSHAAQAKAEGLSPAAVASLAKGEPFSELADAEALAATFVRELLRLEGRSEATYRRLFDAFGAKGIVDLIILASCYQMLADVLVVFDIPAPRTERQGV